MIIIIGRERAARQYATDRGLPSRDVMVVSNNVPLRVRGTTPDEIVVVEGWSEIIDQGAMDHLRIVMATGRTRWVSGVPS